MEGCRMKLPVYLDNAATTRISPSVLRAMMPYLTDYYGNASALYRTGAASRHALDAARRSAAELIGASASEIFFTSGGTESDNWALEAVFEAMSSKGTHIITTGIEHHAVLKTCDYLKLRGAEISSIRPGSDGIIDPDDIRNAIRKDTILISVMTANNETGVLQPIAEIGKIARERDILFHTDAVQAFGHRKISVADSCIDLLSASAHKLNGPKGAGLLYVRNGLRIPPLIYGGSQERSKRAGTENVAAIAGFGEAVRIASKTMAGRDTYVRNLRDYALARIENEISGAELIGHRTERLSNNMNICFHGTDHETLLIALDLRGVCASAGAACSAGAVMPSHVLLQMGLSREEAESCIRFSLSHENTKEEIDYAVDAVKEAVEQIRESNG